MTEKKTLRTCSKGHKYYKSSTCPVCPICAKEQQPESGFLSKLSSPARRAFENAGISSLKQLSAYTEAEILAMHGIGPSAIPKLEESLKEAGLSFRKV